MKHLYLFVLIILGSLNIKAQSFEESMLMLKTFQLDDLKTIKIQPPIERQFITQQIQLIKNGNVSDTLSLNSSQKKQNRNLVLDYILKGDFYLHHKTPKDSLSLDFYAKGLDISLQIKDSILVVESCKKILFQLYKNRKSLNIFSNYLNLYIDYTYDKFETIVYNFYKFNYLGSHPEIRAERIDSLKILYRQSLDTKSPYYSAKIAQLIDIQYSFF